VLIPMVCGMTTMKPQRRGQFGSNIKSIGGPFSEVLFPVQFFIMSFVERWSTHCLFLSFHCSYIDIEWVKQYYGTTKSWYPTVWLEWCDKGAGC